MSIIEDRLKYLNSDEYRSTRSETKYYDDSMQVYFHDGFIGKNMLIAADGGDIITQTLYQIDDVDLYSDIIDIVRKHMDEKRVPLKFLVKKVSEYFALNDNSQHKQLVEYFKKSFPNDHYFSRDMMPYIIDYYNHSSFKGSIFEFGRLFALMKYGTENTKNKYKQEIEVFRNSIDWKFIDENPNPVINISQLKGAGVGACTENSILLCNCLAFLEYESYMLGGKVVSSNNYEEQHNFVVAKKENGKYMIPDSALRCMVPLDNINSPEDLLYLSDVKISNNAGYSISYYSKMSYEPSKKV